MHGAVASVKVGRDVVDAVFDDPEQAPVSDEVRAALRLIEPFTLRPHELTAADIERARDAGLTNEAIDHVFLVAALFNVIDRLADAFDFEVPDDAGLRRGAKSLLRFGYRFPRFLWPFNG